MTIREQVLEALLTATEDLSGERLARRLGCSRNAVWKAIEQLRTSGYTIEAGTNRGYRLVADGDLLSEGMIAYHLRTHEFGRKLEVYGEIDSTNTRAKALAAQGAPHGTLVVAASQTLGRGRFGRKFLSPSGMGVYFSLLLRPKMQADRAVMITSLAAVAAARAIEALAEVEVKIKWVNDLYLSGKKICGILCEAGMDFESGTLDYAIVGIGINVAPYTFPEELSELATSIGNVCGTEISRAQLVAEVMNKLEEMYPQLETGAFMEESRRRSCVLGRELLVSSGNDVYPAKAVDIDERGGLVVQTEAGLRTVNSGEVSIRVEGLGRGRNCR